MSNNQLYPVYVMSIARTLFWINSLLSLIAMIVVIFTLGYLIASPDLIKLGSFAGLMAGLACQLFYFLQMTDHVYACKKGPWIYSIVINTAWIIFYLYNTFTAITVNHQAINGLGPLLMILYPLGFLIASVNSLRMISELQSTDLTDMENSPAVEPENGQADSSQAEQ